MFVNQSTSNQTNYAKDKNNEGHQKLQEFFALKLNEYMPDDGPSQDDKLDDLLFETANYGINNLHLISSTVKFILSKILDNYNVEVKNYIQVFDDIAEKCGKPIASYPTGSTNKSIEITPNFIDKFLKLRSKNKLSELDSTEDLLKWFQNRIFNSRQMGFESSIQMRGLLIYHKDFILQRLSPKYRKFLQNGNIFEKIISNIPIHPNQLKELITTIRRTKEDKSFDDALKNHFLSSKNDYTVFKKESQDKGSQSTAFSFKRKNEDEDNQWTKKQDTKLSTSQKAMEK